VIKTPPPAGAPEGAERYCLRDPSGESDQVLFLSEGALWLVSRLDGSRDLLDLQTEFARATGEIVPRQTIEELITHLEEVSFLDSPGYRERARQAQEEFRRASRRPAAFAGRSYEADPSALGPWIDSLLVGGGGKATDIAEDETKIRGLVAPHIDPMRGARVYGSAYGMLRGHPARRIIILGISHGGGAVPFVPLAKDLETPFGDCPADHDAIARLCGGLPYDPGGFEILHRSEHSIEFQAVFLRRILSDWSERRVIPILCCSPWLPDRGREALGYPDSWGDAFVENLRALIDGETLVIAGVDFSHVGRRFGDEPGGVAQMRATIEEADRGMMERIGGGDASGFESQIAAEEDARRVCGYPALRTLLRVLPDSRGRAIDYGIAIDESIDSLVSFGALVLY
jgi:hypothetical protein